MKKEPRVLPRKTLLEPCQWEGKGLHSGEPVSVRVLPGEHGIRFLTQEGWLPARADHVTETRRCTQLGSISTVEHLLSAIWGLGLTDVDIEVSGQELPGLDGSSKLFVAGLLGAGMADCGTLEVVAPYARIYDKGDGHSLAIGAGEGHWRYDFDTGTRWPGVQSLELRFEPGVYEEQIAAARTLVFEEELEVVQKMGLGRGLDAESVLILGQAGYLNSPRFGDEPVRHKMLDLIGDLCLSGVPIGAVDVIAHRSGHTANVRAAAKLAAASQVIAHPA